MTFEQWLEKEHPETYAVKDTHGIRDWVEWAKEAFEAGKESAKESK